MDLKRFFIFALLVVLIAVISISFNSNNSAREKATARIGQLYITELQRFDSSLKEYPKYFNDSVYATRLYKYQELLFQYKQIECLFTYLHPKEAYETFLLTPRAQERDFGLPFPDNWLWLGPFGIDPDSILQKRTRNDSLYIRSFIERSVNNFRKLLAETDLNMDKFPMTETDVFDALRLQMARISTMGLSNGDVVIEHGGMPGLEGAFDSWSNMVRIYTEVLPASQGVFKQKLLDKLNKAEQVLDDKPAFSDFNRMEFLTEHLIPITHHFNELQAILRISYKKDPRALNYDARHIYDKGALNTDYFSPSKESYLTRAKAELGKLLFFDPILSDNNQRACASCHKPAEAFTDGNKTSIGFDMEKNLARNSPTVINALFQKQQFWDLRATSLEDQLDSVINNKDELHSSFEVVVDKINSSPEYKKLFHEAFPGTQREGIQRRHVKAAIASYERMLTGLDSRFDQYVRGDKSKLNAAEINGFNLFMGKAKCASCHFAPLFNGALPPLFDSTEHRSIGVPLKDTMDVYQVDPDTGFSRVRKSPFNHFSFKVPSIRNAELTAPYMHNGVFKTLEQVIEFYDHAGGSKFTKQMRPGMKGLPFFMILPEKLNLTPREKADLVLFIKALTDTSAARNVPSRLPELRGKYAGLNKRKLGGEY